MQNQEVAMKVLEMLLNSNVQKSDETIYEFKVGKKYFIRTVTHILVGKCVAVDEKEVFLSKCSWIADTGRYHDCLKTGEFSEVEPYPPALVVGVNRGSFIDRCEWLHDLPTVQK